MSISNITPQLRVSTYYPGPLSDGLPPQATQLVDKGSLGQYARLKMIIASSLAERLPSQDFLRELENLRFSPNARYTPTGKLFIPEAISESDLPEYLRRYEYAAKAHRAIYQSHLLPNSREEIENFYSQDLIRTYKNLAWLCSFGGHENPQIPELTGLTGIQHDADNIDQIMSHADFSREAATSFMRFPTIKVIRGSNNSQSLEVHSTQLSSSPAFTFHAEPLIEGDETPNQVVGFIPTKSRDSNDGFVVDSASFRQRRNTTNDPNDPNDRRVEQLSELGGSANALSLGEIEAFQRENQVRTAQANSLAQQALQEVRKASEIFYSVYGDNSPESRLASIEESQRMYEIYEQASALLAQASELEPDPAKQQALKTQSISLSGLNFTRKTLDKNLATALGQMGEHPSFLNSDFLLKVSGALESLKEASPETAQQLAAFQGLLELQAGQTAGMQRFIPASHQQGFLTDQIKNSVKQLSNIPYDEIDQRIWPSDEADILMAGYRSFTKNLPEGRRKEEFLKALSEEEELNKGLYSDGIVNLEVQEELSHRFSKMQSYWDEEARKIDEYTRVANILPDDSAKAYYMDTLGKAETIYKMKKLPSSPKSTSDLDQGIRIAFNEFEVIKETLKK